ncbi:MAG: VCBS repeat-containing protein, partial [Nannocystaceae bacterium]|nr:VCBS repeat-containing protein [Nannocystaceae bacterium]
VAARTGQWDLNRLYVVHSDPGDSLVEVVEGSDKIALISESTTQAELGLPRDDDYPRTLSFADIDGDGRDDLIASRLFRVFIVEGVPRGSMPGSIDDANVGIAGKALAASGGSVLGLPRLPDDEIGHLAVDGTRLFVVPDDLPSGSGCGEGGPCLPMFTGPYWPGYPIAYAASSDRSQRRFATGTSLGSPSTAVRLFPGLDHVGEGSDAFAEIFGGQPDWYRPDPGRPEPFVLGFSIAFVGDLNADGIPDLAMSSRHPTTAIVALSAPDGGSTDLSEALRTGDAAQVYGVEGDDFGWQLAAGRDVTGDGTPDLVVGAPSDADGSAPGGAVYIYSITYE